MSLAQKVLALLFISALLFFGGYFLGKADQREDGLAAQAKGQASIIKDHDTAAAAGTASELTTAQRVSKTAAIFNGIQLGVEHHAQQYPLVSHCGLDADGVRLWIAANNNADPEPAADDDAAVPAAGPAPLGQPAGFALGSRRDGAGVSPVPRQPSGLDRMAESHSAATGQGR